MDGSRNKKNRLARTVLETEVQQGEETKTKLKQEVKNDFQ